MKYLLWTLKPFTRLTKQKNITFVGSIGASGCRIFNRKHRRPTNTPHTKNVPEVKILIPPSNLPKQK